MATHRNPGLLPDSHQESEGLRSSHGASAEELKAFYEDAERTDILERKLSQRKSSTPSMWSRKSLKRTPTAPPPQPSSDATTSPFSTVRSQSLTNGDASPSEASGSQPEKNGQLQLTPSRSVIVDSRPNVPRNESDPWASVPQPSVKRSYPLHNPLGPRWYKNHHLIPPSHTKPSMRPPTFFSPSFPPISTSTMVDMGDDDEPGLSRSPSGSPLPTPTSSQTRVMDKPRSRKTSQTTPDNVDYLDVTDPWGSTYHHTSPYDVFGQTTTQDHPARPRRASMTTAQAHKSTIPSPLSQSTSAVHLHGTQTTIHIPRKLSKRKTTPAAQIFPSQPADHARQASSAPPTPIDNRYQSDSPIGDENSTTLPKRMSVGPPLPTQPSGTPKREKRTSMLGRLVKKFSILKKSSEPTTTFPGYSHSRSNSTTHAHHVDHVDRPEPIDPQPQHSDPPVDENRDIPVEPAHIPPAPEPNVEPPVPPPDKADQSSIISLEFPYPIGRLTITNPDLDNAEEPLPPPLPPAPPSPPRKADEPVIPPTPSPPSPPPPAPTAPPAEVIIPPEVEAKPAIVQSPPPQPPVRLSRFDKPLPPPVPPTPSAPSVALDDCSDSSSSVSSDSSSDGSDDETEAPNTTAAPAPSPGPAQVPTPPPAEANEQPKEAEPKEDTPVKEANEEVPKEKLVVVPPQSPVKSSPPTSPSTITGVKSRTPPQASPSPPPTVLHKRMSSQRSTLNSSPRVNGVASPPPPLDLKVASPPPKAPSPIPKPIQPTTTGESRKSRSYSRSQQTQSPPPPAVPSMIPFPTKSMDRLPTAEELGYPITAYYDSPFSASSVLANPPTPYDHRLSIATSSVPPSLPAKDIYEKPPPVPPPAASKPSPARQTEVFKLVRSSSGNVYASGQTIVAGGQQWEMIESSVDTVGRKKGKEKEKERETLVVPSNSNGREREKSTSYSRHEQSASYDASTRRESKMRAPEYDDKRYSKSRYRSSGHGHSEEDQSPTKVNGKHSSRYYEDRTYYEDKDRERKKDDSRRYKEDESRRYKEDDPRTRGEREERRWREEREERKRREEREDRKRREEREERKKLEEKERKRKEEREERKRKEEEREERRRKEEERRLYEEYEERKRVEEERRKAEREERRRQEEWIRQEEERRAREEEEQLRKEEEDRRRDEDRRRRQEEERAKWEEQERKRRDEEEDRRVMEERRRREEEDRKADERKRRDEREERKRQEEYRRQQEARKRQEEEYAARKKLEDEYRRQQEELANEERRRREREERDKHRKEERSRKEDRRRSKKPDEPSTSSSSQAPRVDTSSKAAAPLPRLERNPSLNARPTSQLPSAAEMNAMRAKESWELDRLWKARSMYGLEPDGVVNNFIPGPGSVSSKSDDTPEPVHGSSHTAFVVASPFHHHQSPMNSIYHSMPLQPPPIIYSSPAAASTIPSIPDTFSNYDPYEYQSPAPRPKATAAGTTTTTRGPSALSRPPLNNPLPEPPRESTYEPAPLHHDSRASWSKYSFTTAN